MPKALEGLRVLELAWYMAIPILGRQLANFGAEVLRIESAKGVDAIRYFPSPKAPGIIYPDFSSGKKSISLSMNAPGAREVFDKLIKISDIYITNFGEDALRKWGADYASVKAVKPDIIMLWHTGFGAKGPYSTYKAFGGMLQAPCGLMELSGFPNGPPAFSTGSYCDYHSPQYGCVLLMGALRYHRRTGKGMLIELPLFEAGTVFLGPTILEYSVNGHMLSRIQNRLRFAAPHGIYPCKGRDRWCAITVFSDIEWEALGRTMGNPSWVKDARFSTLLDRLRNQDELDHLIGEWTKDQIAEELVQKLQQAGVAAGIVFKGQDLAESPHLRQRGFYVETPYYPPPGTMDKEIAGNTLAMNIPIHMSETPPELEPTQRLGEHNDYVYGTLLRMSKEEIKNLTDKGVLV